MGPYKVQDSGQGLGLGVERELGMIKEQKD